MKSAQETRQRLLMPLQIDSRLLQEDSFHPPANPRICDLDPCLFIAVSSAQPAPLTPPQLDQLVARIALYPDPLLAQVLNRLDILERDS